MLKRILLVLMMFGMLLSCVGLQSTNSSFDAPTYTPLPPEAQAGTETAYAPTRAAWNITQTAYIASFPTLNAEQGQIVRQTQDVLREQAYTRAAADAQGRASSIQISTDFAISTAQGTNPYDLASTSIIETATANIVLATVNADANATVFYEWNLTATSRNQTATAEVGTPRVYRSSTPCPFEYAWTAIEIRYRNGLVNAEIRDAARIFCSSDPYLYTLYSHQIVIGEYLGIESHELPAFLEDAVSRLPDYPPYQPEVSETISIAIIGQLYAECGVFTYSDAIAAYESGLRGQELAQALGFSC